MFRVHFQSLISVAALWLIFAPHVHAQDGPQLDKTFRKTVLPFVDKYCIGCHGKDRQLAKLDLSSFRSVESVAKGHQLWEIVLERLTKKEMPPKDSKRQPSQDQVTAVVTWIKSVRRFEAQRTAGDPGLVLARRLSNSEYNYTIRDLTGVDIRPTKTFPVDPANEVGFDNTGESLTMSPALLKKYIAAARQVVDHLVLKPDGFSFAPHAVVTNTDRDKYCVKRIVEFYQRQPTDLTAYFFAAWRIAAHPAASPDDYRNRIEEIAAQEQLSKKYLTTVWKLLHQPAAAGPILALQSKWKALPADRSQTRKAREACDSLAKFVAEIRVRLKPTFADLYFEGNHKGSQPFVLWKNRQYAAGRRSFNAAVLREPNKETEETSDALKLLLLWPKVPVTRTKHRQSFEQFCSVFPNEFYLAERGRDYVGKKKEDQEKGRLLSAGFHSMMGYFRDDQPLYDLILSPAQQREIDQLWHELDFVASAPTRQYASFLWFERTDSRYMRDPEFDFARAEDKDAASPKMIERLAKLYLAKAERSQASPTAIQAIRHFYTEINKQIRWVEQARSKAEPSHLKALLKFAETASRRVFSKSDKEDVLKYYAELRGIHELSHAEAMQDSIVAVLMSPSFLYRIDRADRAKPGQDILKLNNVELANRLSYFLWASMPDAKLLGGRNTKARNLASRKVLVEETQRLLKSPKVRGFVTEFAGNWLDFRRFEEHNAVDRTRFKSFDDQLRASMFEEPIRFLMDQVQNDRPITEMLNAKHTWVNLELAKHYGLSQVSFKGDEWQRVNVDKQMRGGLLTMSVFLTKNSPGLRTSPVKRGYWVVRRLLGERIPPPPPNVPELPADESEGKLSLTEMLARHRNHKSCAGCHNRFDSIGVAFEEFGPIGEHRTKDLGGRPITKQATFPGGHQGAGINGLRSYLQQHRQAEFVDTLCRKVLSYALGRTLMLSDDPLIEDMQKSLQGNGFRFSSLIESIVLSPQFLHKRRSNSN